MKKDLQIFLALQLAAFILAMGSFRLIENRWQAALIAGSGFVLLGLWMVLKSLRWPDRFRYFTFYAARIHLFLFSLPMFLARLRFRNVDFAQIHLLGIPGPMIHRAAEVFYLVIVISTLIDWMRVRKSGLESTRLKKA